MSQNRSSEGSQCSLFPFSCLLEMLLPFGFWSSPGGFVSPHQLDQSLILGGPYRIRTESWGPQEALLQTLLTSPSSFLWGTSGGRVGGSSLSGAARV